MLVVHLTASRFFGGPERQMLELGKALPDEVRSVFISFSENGLCQAFLDEARCEGFETVDLRHDTPRLLAALRELTGVLRRAGADVLCCHGYKAGLLGLLAARRLGIPVIAVSRGWTDENFKVRLYKVLDRLVLRWMDKVVCVSEGQAEKVRRAGISEDRIAVIRNAVRPDRFDAPDPACRDELLRMFLPDECSAVSGQWLGADDAPLARAGRGAEGEGRSPIIIAAAGRLSPEKGFDVFVDAAAQVLHRLSLSPLPSPLSPCFVLFGDGPLRESLARRIADRGLQGKFIMAGFSSNLDRLLPHLDLMVLPSYSEGLPNVALESLAAGVPVVATAVGGTPEVVEDGRTGLLVPPGDAAAMSERIISILSDDALRTSFAAAGRDRVVRQFSFAAQAKSYQTLLASITAAKARTTPRPADATGVCFVIDNLNVAGTESQLLALIRGLDRTKVRPYLCLLDGRSEISRSLEPVDCPTLRLGIRSLRGPSTLARAWRFARFLRRNKIDVVHCFFPDSTRFAVPVARLTGVRRIVASRRNLGHWMTAWDRRLARLYRRWIDVTVANCDACRRAVIEQEGVASDRVVVIPNGIDLDRFKDIPPYTPSLNGRPRRVGMVANLRPVKAPDVFVRAAAIVAQSHPNVIFQIAGSGDAESVRRLVRECGVDNRLELLGQVDDVPSFLAGLDVAVLTSHAEGLSNSLLEYMAAGRPIVATAVGGNTELIEDGVHGLLVPPNQPDSLAESIAGLLAETESAINLSVAARRTAREQFNQTAAVQRHEVFYQRFARDNIPVTCLSRNR